MMTRFSKIGVCIVAAAAVTVSAMAAVPGNGPQGNPPPPRGEQERGGEAAPGGGRMGRGRGPQVPNGLGQAMSEMDRAYKALKTEATDPAKMEQSLKDVALMQRGAAISKTMVPPMVNRMPADKKTEAVESYRTMMVGLMKTLMDLEESISAKKPDDIKKGLTQIEEIMKQGHAEFIPQERQ